MPTEALTPEIIRNGEATPKRFDPRSAAPFVNEPVFEGARRAYCRVARGFFQSAGTKRSSGVVAADVLLWREHDLTSFRTSKLSLQHDQRERPFVKSLSRTVGSLKLVTAQYEKSSICDSLFESWSW